MITITKIVMIFRIVIVMMIKTSPGGSMGIETCSGVSFDSALRHACNHWIWRVNDGNIYEEKKLSWKVQTFQNFSVDIFLTWKMNIFGLMWSFGHWEASANMLTISLRSTPWWSKFVMICHHLSWSVVIIMKSYHHWPFRHSRWSDQHCPPCAREREHKQQAICNRSCWSGEMLSSYWTMINLIWCL